MDMPEVIRRRELSSVCRRRTWHARPTWTNVRSGGMRLASSNRCSRWLLQSRMPSRFLSASSRESPATASSLLATGGRPGRPSRTEWSSPLRRRCRVAQQADLLSLETITRGLPIDEGGYHWRGELRLWDNEVLMGWYAANDKSVRSKGTMYFVLHTHGQQLTGRWVGLSYDGAIVTGWGSMARSESDARALIDELKRRDCG